MNFLFLGLIRPRSVGARFFAIVLGILVTQMCIAGEDSPYLTGDWAGTRQKLSNKGFDFTLLSKNDFLGVASGGAKRKFVTMGNLDMKLALDAEKLAGIHGLTAMVYGLADYHCCADGLAAYVGDTQVTSNIDAPQTAKLYEAWLQQNLLDDHLSFLVGLRDFNQEFYAQDSAGLFLNSSFGVGKEIAQTGQNGPSIFPTTSLAGRFTLQFDHAYLKVAAFDGVPGDPDDSDGTHIKLKSEDGLFYASEMAFLRGGESNKNQLHAKYAVGLWAYSAKFDRIDGGVDAQGDPRRNRSYGFYFLADQNLTDDFSIFVRFGKAASTVNEYDYNLSGGIKVVGLIPARTNDSLGLAVSSVHAGGGLKESRVSAGNSSKDFETTLEATYRIEAYPGVAIQPDFQYVIFPNSDPTIDNAVVVGARLEVNF